MSVPIAEKISIRDYQNRDLSKIVEIYKAAFAEPPWNEKWSYQQVVRQLNGGISKPNSIVLVAENSENILGMTWGFDLSLNRFPFLADNYVKNTNYIAELAVSPCSRKIGTGTLLGRAYVERAREKGIPKIILRTDERNPAALKLYKGLGFSDINARDPTYKNRIYLSKLLEGENGN